MLKAKITPWRAKASGTRSKVLGELSFIHHGEVSINPQSKLKFLLLPDGQTSLTSACVQNGQTLRRFYIFFNYLETSPPLRGVGGCQKLKYFTLGGSPPPTPRNISAKNSGL